MPGLRRTDTEGANDPTVLVADRSGSPDEIGLEFLILGCVAQITRVLDLAPEIADARDQVARGLGTETGGRESMKHKIASGVAQQHSTDGALLCRNGLTNPPCCTKRVVRWGGGFERQDTNAGERAEVSRLANLVRKVRQERRGNRDQGSIDATRCEHEQPIAESVTKADGIALDESDLLQCV